MIATSQNISITDHASEIGLPHCAKLGINQKNDNDATIYRHGVIITV